MTEAWSWNFINPFRGITAAGWGIRTLTEDEFGVAIVYTMAVMLVMGIWWTVRRITHLEKRTSKDIAAVKLQLLDALSTHRDMHVTYDYRLEGQERRLANLEKQFANGTLTNDVGHSCAPVTF